MNYGHIISLIQSHVTSIVSNPGFEMMSCEINNAVSMVEKGILLLKHKRIAKSLLLFVKAFEMSQDVMSISRELYSIMALARIVGNLNGIKTPDIKLKSTNEILKRAV